MTDITITEADRERAASFATQALKPVILRGEWDGTELLLALAAHRLSAIEEAAKIADAHEAEAWGVPEEQAAAREIATAIRALAQPPVAKDIRKMREGN